MSNAVVPTLSLRWSLLLGAALVLCLTGCGGGGGGGTTGSQCGNGRINDGEQCDDGNTVDTDTCTGVCRDARCGDGAIRAGVEVCDGTNLGESGFRCTDLGYSLGEDGQTLPSCAGDCATYDVSLCGPQFTPTPLRPTATPTYTPTSTATPLATTCGNGLLEPGETCQSCADDCVAAACTPSGEDSTFSLALSAGRTPNQVSVELAYRSSVISIPGSGNDISVRQRVRAAPPIPTSFTVSDLDYAVDIHSTRSSGLPSPFATARFDDCSGAAAPTALDVSCVVTGCADASGPIAGCRCTATLQP